MSDPIRAYLVAGGRYHDIDFARMELLKLLGEDPEIKTRVGEDYSDLDAITESDFLLTYTCDVRPTPEQQEALAKYVTEGGRWFADDAEDEVVMGYEAATYEQRKVGDEFYLSITPSGQVEPVLRKFKVVGVLARTGSQADGTVFMPYATAQKVFGRPEQLTIVGIKLKEFAGPAVREFTERWIKLPEVQVVGLEQVKSTLVMLVGAAQVMLTAVAVIAVVVATIGVMNTILMSVDERIGEIGSDVPLSGPQRRACRACREGRELRDSEVSRFWTDKAIEWIRTDPAAWARLMLRKLHLSTNVAEPWNIRSFTLSRDFSWVLRLPLPAFGWLAPLAVAGIVCSARDWRRLFPLYCALASIWASVKPSSLTIRPRTEMPAVWTLSGSPVTRRCHHRSFLPS